MKSFILVGAGQFADYVQHLLENSLQEKVAAFSVNRKFLPSGCAKKNDKPLVCLEDLPILYSPEHYNIAIAMLGKDLYQTRQKLFDQCLHWGYEIPNILHPTVVNQAESIGMGNIIGAGTILEPYCTIGSGNVFFGGSLISHNDTVGDFNLFASQICPAGNVVIGSHCFIGAGSVIKNKVHIADYTLVGATAFVAADTKPYDVVVPTRSTVLAGKNSLEFGQ